MDNLDKLSIHELETMLVELFARRAAGLISPGEYRSRAIDVTDAYYKKLKQLNTSKSKNDAYKRAMGIV